MVNKNLNEEEVSIEEEVLFTCAAKLRANWRGYFGRFEVTNSQIIFALASRGSEPFALLMPWEEIVEYKSYNFLGFVPNRILIKLTSGDEFHFMVANRKKLMETLNTFIVSKNVSK
ncbi:MAG: hypothetical protein ACRC30_13215 [Clostridium sp.]